ncbi:hypothetical protein Salat_1435900 [Sesamum alatum]|uniref:Uncharacterized protein n=1 Tax=Sesamum alatum TaxID=300844 RepID=A0AAE1YAZ6_9LAMI|nr:hypothetical protein Salat_1435900 [Sesamum alatum]
MWTRKKDTTFITTLLEWVRRPLGLQSTTALHAPSPKEVYDVLPPSDYVGFTWLPLPYKVKARARFWRNALETVRRARWYCWKGEEEYERLAIIFEPPMGENVDEGAAVNPVADLVHEGDIVARDEGEKEEDMEEGG